LLASGAIDLAFVHAGTLRRRGRGTPRVVTPPEVASSVIEQEDLVLALPRRHPLSASRQVAFAALAAEPFVLYNEGSTVRDVVLAATAAAGFTPRVALEATGNDTVRAFVSAGFGITVLPRSLAAAPGPPITTVELTGPRVARTVSIAWRRHGAMPPAVQAVFDLLRTSLTAQQTPRA
jgi:DNA-binding transcriptional LysR family regulator